MARTKPIHLRSNWEVFWVFVVFSPLCAVVLLVVSVLMVLRSGGPRTIADWIGLVWCFVVLPVGAIALPAVGWRELHRRRTQSQNPEPPRP